MHWTHWFLLCASLFGYGFFIGWWARGRQLTFVLGDNVIAQLRQAETRGSIKSPGHYRQGRPNSNPPPMTKRPPPPPPPPARNIKGGGE